ncbi:triose-phosphate isomerase [Brevundimonas sp. S30B]|uniref:triose-phosphate isomerase n=1 Tax=unclassified Brevundimonas TaxID=2622653 RepID=UPI0010720678|nr:MULTISPECIES: triose-phosphate isomerase [unclassified Brevundimonas]QBX37492.1 triose-phosphate isomerase [Brevundimonas sp. MF30-B]TFW03715.1 triose-phosphate isomerase [Brevundimonas sp. S30B]
MKQSVKLIAGNWKMNGQRDGLAQARRLVETLRAEPGSCRLAVMPPATLVSRLAQLVAGSVVEVGGQDCRAEAEGAFTGDISAELLAEAGAELVILGHSERRQGHGETDADVCAKVEAALRAGLEPVICIGETLQEREAGSAIDVVRSQISGSLPQSLADHAFAVAYEPVWAIGTGLTPTLEQIAEVHAAVRAALVDRLGEGGRAAPILYGGSVKPGNAAEILAVDEVGGALVGGASLKADDFLGIIRAA